MNRNLLIFFYFIICISARSQSYTNSLPQVGKFTYRCNFNGYVQPAFFNKESATHYDFNFLSTSWSVKEALRPSSTSINKKSYNAANIVHLKANNEEEFYNVKNGACYSYGKVIELKNCRRPIAIKHLPHDLGYSTTINAGSKYTNNFRTDIKLARKDIIYSNLSTISDDSIKVEIQTKQNVTATFEGTMELSNKTRKVRRYEAQVNNTLSIFTKKIGEGWKASTITINALPSEIIAYYKAKSYTKVFFLCPDFIGPILSYDIIDEEIKNIAFQENEVSPLSINVVFDEGEIIAWPNPTVGPITFELFNYPYDDYQLEVYNIVGKKILSKTFSTADGRSLSTDLSALKKGTYIYSIFDGKGRKLLTKRISITSI